MTVQSQKIGVQVPKILLPKAGVDMKKWAVVACDQYTSEPEYWQEVESIVGEAPSTLRMIYPEVYLKETNKHERIEGILSHMKQYPAECLEEHEGFILVDRKTSHAPSRKGLMVAIDLEKYDFNKGSQTLVRATEGTVLDRLPPRIEIRKDANIESPHVMILIDDPRRTVIEPLFAKADRTKLYDTDLMMNGGHITGYKVEKDEEAAVIAALEKLAEKEVFAGKYGITDKDVLLFAVGDGNHSLATAKSCWELFKKTLSAEEQATHPARFALVELVNVHDAGLVFEPIHRVVFGADGRALLADMEAYFTKKGKQVAFEIIDSHEEAADALENNPHGAHGIELVSDDFRGIAWVDSPDSNLPVGTLQEWLDDYVKRTGLEIDYVHGTEAVEKLSKGENTGFYLPAMDKQDLFKTVILDGALPRKTFSMGEAEEKRYYLECRGIR